MQTSSFFNYPDQPEEAPAEELLFLAEWTAREWDKFFSLTQTYRFGAGDYVYHYGDGGRGDGNRAFFLVSAGQFERLIDKNGTDVRIGTVDTGSVLGEQRFLDDEPHSTTVRALTDGELVRFSYEAFERLSAQEPDLALQLIWELGRIVSLRFRQTTRMVSR